MQSAVGALDIGGDGALQNDNPRPRPSIAALGNTAGVSQPQIQMTSAQA